MEAEVLMAGRTAVVGEIRGLTGDTAIESGTGDEDRGVDPVGVVLPLFGYRHVQIYSELTISSNGNCILECFL